MVGDKEDDDGSDCKKYGGSEMEPNTANWLPVKHCNIEEDSNEESYFISGNSLFVTGDEEDGKGLEDAPVGKPDNAKNTFVRGVTAIIVLLVSHHGQTISSIGFCF